MLKGPTGCGKTRLVEHIAAAAGVPLYTVSCHGNLTASDLLGHYVFADGSTTWVDGPLTRAAREGGVCYLDEVVEARHDATSVFHSLADHRRELNIEPLGGTRLKAADGFLLVVSYNPGRHSILNELNSSTRQRMVSIELGFPAPEVEVRIVRNESGVDARIAIALARVGAAIRRLDDAALHEVASTRTLITAAALMSEGLSFREAAMAAIAGPLTDDCELRRQLTDVIVAHDPS